MTDQAIAEDVGENTEAEGEGEGEGAAKPRRGFAGKKLVLFIALPVLLLIGGGAGVYFSGLLDPLLGVEHEPEVAEGEAAPAGPGFFYDLPEMLVNLNSNGRNTSFLKISVSLELRSQEDVPLVDGVLPRIVDNFQVYLRELRVDDLSGSAGMQRLREELLLRVNAAAQANVVRDVLFKEMLVQ